MFLGLSFFLFSPFCSVVYHVFSYTKILIVDRSVPPQRGLRSRYSNHPLWLRHRLLQVSPNSNIFFLYSKPLYLKFLIQQLPATVSLLNMRTALVMMVLLSSSTLLSDAAPNDSLLGAVWDHVVANRDADRTALISAESTEPQNMDGSVARMSNANRLRSGLASR
jgi:hypothetical protein